MDSEKSTHTIVAREITVHPTVGMERGNDMEIWVPTLSSEKDKMAVSESRQSKGHRGKKTMGTKNTNAFKKFSHTSGNKTISSLKTPEKLTKKENEPSSSNTTQPGQLWLGYLVQEQGHPNTRRDDCPNQSITHRHDGLVRSGSQSSVAEPLPYNASKHQVRKFTFGSSNMGLDSQPMVKVPHRHPPDNGEGSRALEQAKEAIGSASLGQIEVATSRQEGHRFQGDSDGTHGELSNAEAVLDLGPNPKM